MTPLKSPPPSSLGEKENSLKTDDYGRDLSSVQTLLTKQVAESSSSPPSPPLLLFTLLSLRRRPLMLVFRPSSRRASATSRP